jgi:hypothetical protein
MKPFSNRRVVRVVSLFGRAPREPKVIANEIDPRRRTLAHALGLKAFTVDAEFIDDLLPHDLIP